jgi:hypothetical protein
LITLGGVNEAVLIVLTKACANNKCNLITLGGVNEVVLIVLTKACANNKCNLITLGGVNEVVLIVNNFMIYKLSRSFGAEPAE